MCLTTALSDPTWAALPAPLRSFSSKSKSRIARVSFNDSKRDIGDKGSESSDEAKRPALEDAAKAKERDVLTDVKEEDVIKDKEEEDIEMVGGSYSYSSAGSPTWARAEGSGRPSKSKRAAPTLRDDREGADADGGRSANSSAHARARHGARSRRASLQELSLEDRDEDEDGEEEATEAASNWAGKEVRASRARTAAAAEEEGEEGVREHEDEDLELEEEQYAEEHDDEHSLHHDHDQDHDQDEDEGEGVEAEAEAASPRGGRRSRSRGTAEAATGDGDGDGNSAAERRPLRWPQGHRLERNGPQIFYSSPWAWTEEEAAASDGSSSLSLGQLRGGFSMSAEHFELNEADIEEHFAKGGGKGGQHVNKTTNAVHLRHMPTNTIVRCHAHRSLEMNRKQARAILASRLDEMRLGPHSAKQLAIAKVRKQKDRRRRRSKAHRPGADPSQDATEAAAVSSDAGKARLRQPLRGRAGTAVDVGGAGVTQLTQQEPHAASLPLSFTELPVPPSSKQAPTLRAPPKPKSSVLSQ